MSARSAASPRTRRGWCTSRWTRTAWCRRCCGPRCETVRPRPKFLYTVPTFHNPAGVTLSVERRAEVLAICREYGVAVVEDNPYGLLGLQRAHLPRVALARPRRRLPGLVLQDVRVRPAGGLGARSARRARPPRAGGRIGDPLPAEFHPDAGLAVSGGTRLAQPGQDVHRGLPRPPRRHAPRAGDLPRRPVARGTSPMAASTCGSPCPRASTRRRCSRARSRRGSPTRRAPGSTPTVSGSRQLRLSYCYPSPERITEGVRRLAGVLAAELDVLHTFGSPARPAVGRGPQAPSPHTP